MNAVVRTWNGERPLGETYWLWFILPGVALGAVAFVAGMILAPAAATAGGALTVVTVAVVAAQLALTYGVGTGVIRSAMNSDAPIHWRWLAGIAVVVGMIWVPFGAYNALMATAKVTTLAPVVTTATLNGMPEDKLSDYQANFLAEARATLPSGGGTIQLTALAFQGKQLVYGYSVDQWLDYEPDAIMYKSNRLSEFCYAFKQIYHPGEIEMVQHRYFIRSGQTMTIMVQPRECGIRTGDAPAAPAGSGNFLTDFEKSTGIDVTP